MIYKISKVIKSPWIVEAKMLSMDNCQMSAAMPMVSRKEKGITFLAGRRNPISRTVAKRIGTKAKKAMEVGVIWDVLVSLFSIQGNL